MRKRAEIVVGRIETLAVDAVVNAANRALAPGSGVDGALRGAAGPELTRLTDTMAPIQAGEAVMTPGFDALARYIIHTAAPVWFLEGGEEEKIATLGRCYTNSMMLADTQDARDIAFPCIGTGVFGWPKKLACHIALRACAAGFERAQTLRKIVFCCFTEGDAAFYRAELEGL